MKQVSIWESETFFSHQNIVIAGSGFVGLWCALKLINKYPQRKITIIEREPIPTGASTRNAGYSCFGSPSELLADIEKMGLDATLQLVEKRFKGLLQIQAHFLPEMIDYDACGGYECFAADSKDWPICNDKLEWLNQELAAITGSAKSFELATGQLAEFGLSRFSHMIANNMEGGLHSGKLIQVLLKKVQAAGVQVLCGISLCNWQKINDHLQLQTGEGFTITCDQLLLCTNGFTGQLLPGIDVQPCRGQVLVSAPIPQLQLRGTFHFDQGYYYFRNLGNRLLLGGARNVAFEEENTDTMETTNTITDTLIGFIRQYLLPDQGFEITHKWSGIMAMGKEKMPIVRAIDDCVFCCVRMSGMGVALAPEVADEIADMM